MTEEKEEPRLYSKPARVPKDVIAPEHVEVHADLERWGSWNRERFQLGTCASMEKDYFKGGRDATPPATAPMLVNPHILRVERVVILVGVHVPQHGECIRQFYIRRSDPYLICRLLEIRWEDFPRWTYDCRQAVLNVLAVGGI